MCENADVAKVGRLLGDRKIDMSCFNHHSRILLSIAALHRQHDEHNGFSGTATWSLQPQTLTEMRHWFWLNRKIT